MLGNYFYHSKTRTAVAIFGRLFSEIYIGRSNAQQRVPLAYAPRQKFLDRIREQVDLDTDQAVAIKLPRMSFELITMAYDANRQLSKNVSFTSGGSTTTRNRIYTSVPYNLTFQLNIMAKSQDDALQIVEQILPYFTPQYNLTMIPFPSRFPNVKEDVPITLQGVDMQDDYEGDMAQRRTITYTLTFEMKLNYYSYIPPQEIIDTAKVNVNLEESTILIGQENNYVEIKVRPDPNNAGPDDTYGWDISFDFATDPE